MFGISVLASLIVITLIWGRLASHGVGPARLVPTLWMILGPLGQSVTAANLLGLAARDALPAPYATALRMLGVLYGVPVWGFAAAVGGHRGDDHGAHRAPPPAVLADLVVVHVPGRHLRHRDHHAGPADRVGGPPGGRRGLVRRAGRGLAHRRRPHRPRHRPGPLLLPPPAQPAHTSQ